MAGQLVWRMFLVIDVALVIAFGVTATFDPYGVLKNLDLPFLRGLLPTLIVLALRASTLWLERRLLGGGQWGAVLASRAASVAAFFYLGRGFRDHQYGRPEDLMLGGTLAYALIGAIVSGSIQLIHGLRGIPWRVDAKGALEREAARQRPAIGDRVRNRDSLTGFVSVFVSVTGLVLVIDDVERLAAAALLAAIAVALIAWATRQ